MATRLRKVRRLRGSRTHGWGQVGQHRRTGAKGGSGMAGLHKHKWSYLVKYAPDHFGSNEWHPPHPSTTSRWINVQDLERIAGASSEIDLGKLGIDKLLGQGSLTRAISVKVERATANAIEKVNKAGGKVEVEIKAEEEQEKKQPEAKTGSKPKSEQKQQKAKK